MIEECHSTVYSGISNATFSLFDFRVVMSVTISAKEKKTKFGSFLPSVVCRKVHVLCMLFVFVGV